MTKVKITQDLRRDDGTGWQVGEVDGWQVAREFVRPLESVDPETGIFIYAPGPAISGPWCYNVIGFTTRPEWPEYPQYDGNCGHVARSDGSTQPVRLFGRTLFVTPNGTENWTH